MDTLGALVDKLSVVNLKMWSKQENLYETQRMNLEQFKEKYFNEKGIEELFKNLHAAADLNIQRNNLVDEIDEKIVTLVNDTITGKDLSKYIQKKHKSY